MAGFFVSRPAYEDNKKEIFCPSCARNGFAAVLSDRIIHVITYRGKSKKSRSRISINPIYDLELDPTKEYLQCQRCWDIYDKEDIAPVWRQEDLVPISGPALEFYEVYKKGKNK